MEKVQSHWLSDVQFDKNSYVSCVVCWPLNILDNDGIIATAGASFIQCNCCGDSLKM